MPQYIATLGFTKNSLIFHLASMLINLNYLVDAWIAGVPMDNYGGASDMINKVGGESQASLLPRYRQTRWQVVSRRENEKIKEKYPLL
jgi:hypothetical protein